MRNTQIPRDSEWNILKLLRWTTAYFQSHAIESSRAAAEILLAHVLNIDRVDLYIQYDRPLNQSELHAFKSLIKRRLNREPVAYILGRKEFWSLNLAVTADVLIPRPETESLVEWALARLPRREAGRQRRILGLGTGTGAIVLALAKERPGHRFVATDISTGALALASRNAADCQLADVVSFICGDWLMPFRTGSAKFDLIVSNPPYIPEAEIENLQPEITRFEPRLALDGDADGLGCIRSLIHTAPAHLVPGGELMLEMGADQKEMVTRLVEDAGHYTGIEFRKDYSGNDRVARMQRK